MASDTDAKKRRDADEDRALAPGLYMVATPIGTARDITLRALDILRSVDLLAAEDTRTARKLLELHGVALSGRPIISYHDHNGPEARPRILSALTKGQSVAYMSEAGTPLVADPGYQLVRAAVDADIDVFSAPGASAVLAALTVAGLPTDRFLFAGFPPGRGEKLSRWLDAQATSEATVVFYESAKRIHRLLDVLSEVYGATGQIALCRELTKKHEEVLRGRIGDVSAAIAERTLKGELVVVVGPRLKAIPDDAEIAEALARALQDQSVKTAVAEVAATFGLPRRKVYQMAVAMRRPEDSR
ncbi:MAG: 16S rRNA (cytidine(1402)-2'-O)-methyltransferase [Pseudomonadota bacterium]